MKNKQKILQFTGIFLFCYLFLISVFFNVNEYQPLLIVLCGFIIYFLGNSLLTLSKKEVMVVIIFLLMAGAALRFLWAVYCPTLPFSDFLYYHNEATTLARGEISAPLGKNFGFPAILSLGYRIYPDQITAKLINALASTVSLVLLALLALKITGAHGAIFATLLFALLPSEINMVSVTGTEVMATMGLVATAYFLMVRYKSGVNSKYALIAGLIFGIGITFRFSLLFFLPAFLVYLLLLPGKKSLKKGRLIFVFVAGIMTIWLLIFAWHSLYFKTLNFNPFKLDEAFVYLSGTNQLSSGGWTEDDAKLYYSWPAEDRSKRAKLEALRRIKTDFWGFLLLIPKKFSRLFKDNTYGSIWCFQKYEKRNAVFFSSKNAKTVIQVNSLTAQIMYIIILFFATISFVLKPVHIFPLSALVVVLLIMIPHIILEVQPRYHHPIMPFIILAAGYGLKNVFKKGEELQSGVITRE